MRYKKRTVKKRKTYKRRGGTSHISQAVYNYTTDPKYHL